MSRRMRIYNWSVAQSVAGSYCFGQAGISLFVIGNCFEELCTGPRGRGGGSCGGGLIGRLVLGPSRNTETQGNQRKFKKIKRDTAHRVLLCGSISSSSFQSSIGPGSFLNPFQRR